jgi:hypothetical protein
MTVKIRVLGLVLGFALAAGSCQQAFGWNDRGHMSVAYIAYKQLTAKTRDRVNTLLKLNPKYSDWAATVDEQAPTASADDRNLMIFMIAATWADQIKRDSAYTKDGTQNGNRPQGSPDPGKNTGYDAGGNLVKLGCTKCQLHAFWDDLLGTQNKLKTVMRAARKLPQADATLAAKSDEKDWVAESFQEAKQAVYAPPIEPGNGPFTLTSAYKKAAGKLAKQRVALAGTRLANLLNAELQ